MQSRVEVAGPQELIKAIVVAQRVETATLEKVPTARRQKHSSEHHAKPAGSSWVQNRWRRVDAMPLPAICSRVISDTLTAFLAEHSRSLTGYLHRQQVEGAGEDPFLAKDCAPGSEPIRRVEYRSVGRRNPESPI